MRKREAELKTMKSQVVEHIKGEKTLNIYTGIDNIENEESKEESD